jgi:pyruvate formate-lyase activating enzyme-like uncharacterized protein
MGPIIKNIYDAYQLIKDKNNWTQGYYQRDEFGNKCEWLKGCSFCALGAISFVRYSGNVAFNAQCLLQRMSEKLFNKPIQKVNDDPFSSKEEAHKNVLLVYEEALRIWKDREPTEEEFCVKHD